MILWKTNDLKLILVQAVIILGVVNNVLSVHYVAKIHYVTKT